jgi:threonine synthase
VRCQRWSDTPSITGDRGDCHPYRATARGQALQAAEESGGRIIAVSDDEILAMQRRLAAGPWWSRPGGRAIGWAADIRLALTARLAGVAVCTGHGPKIRYHHLHLSAPRLIPAEMAL